MYQANKQTLEMQSFGIEGNIIDHSWYKIIKKFTPKGDRTDSNAIILLADIVYWYKPCHKIDEDSGIHMIGKKYKADILQRSYSEIEEKFGFTKDQARSALETLEFYGIIEREFRVVKIGSDLVPNRMFIKFHHIKLMELMKKHYDELANPPLSSEKIDDVPEKNRTYPLRKPTYTKTTPKTSPKNDDDGMKPSVSRVKLLFLNGKEQQLSKEDLYSLAVTSGKNWKVDEIEYLFERLLTYQDQRISDLEKLCDKILSNKSKADRAEKFANKPKKQEQKKPTHENIPVEPSKNLRRWGDVMPDLNK